MSYLFLLVGIVFGVLSERYLLPIFDLFLSKFTNHKSLQALRVQRSINEIENEIQLEALDTQYEATLIEKDITDIRMSMQPQDTHVIGFQHDVEEEMFEDDEDCCKKIGFGK